MNYKIVEQVSRKKKSMSGVLCVVMIIFAVLFVVMGITISQAFMLPGISEWGNPAGVMSRRPQVNT